MLNTIALPQGMGDLQFVQAVGIEDRSGNDTLYGGKRGGAFDGGAGYDTFSLEGAYADYRFATDAATGDMLVTRVTPGAGATPGAQTRSSNVEALSVGGVTVPLAGWSLEPDAIRGTAGEDVAVVSAGYGGAQVRVSDDGREVTVTLTQGTPVTLRDVELLQFADLRIRVADELRQGASQHAYSEGDDAVVGNERGCVLQAGGGDDRLTGNGGDDTLYGGKGQDMAIYRGLRSDYRVDFDIETGVITVTDLVPGRDGQDTLHGIERLRFSDLDLSALDVAAPALSELPDGGRRALSGGWDALASNLKLAQQQSVQPVGGDLGYAWTLHATSQSDFFSPVFMGVAADSLQLDGAWTEPALVGTGGSWHDSANCLL